MEDSCSSGGGFSSSYFICFIAPLRGWASSEKNSAFAHARLSVSPFAHSVCGSRHVGVTGYSRSQHTGQYALLTESMRRFRSGFWSSGAASMMSPYDLGPLTICRDQQFLEL